MFLIHKNQESQDSHMIHQQSVYWKKNVSKLSLKAARVISHIMW